jgi:hypothetical protein
MSSVGARDMRLDMCNGTEMARFSLKVALLKSGALQLAVHNRPDPCRAVGAGMDQVDWAGVPRAFPTGSGLLFGWRHLCKEGLPEVSTSDQRCRVQ